MASKTSDYNIVRKDIAAAILTERHDKGTCGPSMIRLIWYSCATYNRHQNNGGSQGGTMRFPEQYSDPANKGLENRRNALKPVHDKHPWITYANLYTLDGCVAVEQRGRPHNPSEGGRYDTNGKDSKPSFQETAALIGAHAIGECHKSHQGFDGPWSPTQTEFTNKLYKMLLNRAWKEKKWDGPRQFEGEETHKLMMLPTDMVILKEPFRRYTELYAED
ncbi:hypothetical protein INT46_000021 [Mucor plumbeus]|uniref:Peroxidase n=1 Tax=Mucor plumbeus TaxID=97098 RepID=A0A8H7UYU8_9FUNG|nr:hypothetical protein INT46_000021 [Mucor plumbeus]